MTVRVEIGVTHEVIINGDKSWIRLAITDDYDINPEDPSVGLIPNRVKDLDEAVSDLSEKVNKQIIKVIEDTVETVNNYTAKDK
jgi:hypothetical protein